jgi:hypothetical protein
MKLFKLAPIAGLLLANAAFAVDPAAPAANITIYAAGASAQLATVSGALASVCEPNVGTTQQIEYYQGYYDSATGLSSNTVASSSLRAFKCKIKTGTPANPLIDGQTILFVYSALDGSASGVQYVARQLPRTFLNFAACPTTPTTASTGSAAADLALVPAGSKRFNCNLGTSTIRQDTPVAGTSDVEPAQFQGVNAPAIGDVNASDLATLETRPGRAVIFGVYGNTKMWLELQKRQGILPTSATAPVMPTDSGFTEAQRPNITSQEYRNIVTGNAVDMSNISGNGKPVAAALPLAGGNYTLARRVAGSGTQAISNIFFLNNSCGTLTGTALIPVDATGTGGPQTIIEGSASSDVITALKTTVEPAIGVLSLETPATAAVGTSAAAIAPFTVDGVLPSRANVIAGQYGFYAEETSQWNKNVVSSTQTAVLERLAKASGIVATLQVMSTAAQNSSGVLPNATNGLPGSNTTWILQGSRGSNNCKPAEKVN